MKGCPMLGFYENSFVNEQMRARIGRLQVALARVNQILLRSASREEVLKNVSDVLVKEAGFRLAWIGWLNPKTQVVVPAAFSGQYAAEYLQMVKVTAGGGEQGQGPTGLAIREGRAFVSNDFFSDSRTRPWHDAARKAGIRSSAAFPFRGSDGMVCGTLNVYSGELDVFQVAEVAILEEISSDLSYRLSQFNEEGRPVATPESADKYEMFKKFAETAGEVFWIMSVQPELILYVNPAFEHIWNRSVAELYRNPRLWMDSIHLDDRPRIMELFSNWIQRIPGSVYDVEYRIIRPDGTTRWISDRGFLLTEGDAPGSRVAGIAADITDRKIAEEKLQVSRERYKNILDNMMEGCMIIGFDWTYLYVNEAAARHGYQDVQNLTGRTMMSVYPNVERSVVFAGYKRCMEDRVPQRFESSYTFADGTTSWYEFRVAPIPEGIFVLSLDISDRKKAGKDKRKDGGAA